MMPLLILTPGFLLTIIPLSSLYHPILYDKLSFSDTSLSSHLERLNDLQSPMFPTLNLFSSVSHDRSCHWPDSSTITWVVIDVLTVVDRGLGWFDQFI